MRVETEFFIIESNEELPYIDELIKYIEQRIINILDFFEVKEIGKTRIIIWNDINKYKDHLMKYTEYKEDMCADTFDGNINVLALNEARKTEAHSTMTQEEFYQNISHEFVHICQQHREEIKPERKDSNSWLYEALATNLGNKEQYGKLEYFSVDKSNLEKFNEMGDKRYEIAYTIGRYLLENYSKEEILELVKDPNELSKITQEIVENTKNWLDTKYIMQNK